MTYVYFAITLILMFYMMRLLQIAKQREIVLWAAIYEIKKAWRNLAGK